jgi:hypothetical protein
VFLFLSKKEHLFLSGATMAPIELFSFKNSTRQPKSPFTLMLTPASALSLALGWGWDKGDFRLNYIPIIPLLALKIK